MSRTRAFLCALLVTLSVAAGVPAAAQEDLVTLTVAVTTADDDPVGGAAVTALWDGGSTSRTTASNGKVFIDVPAGADVQIGVDHADYVRNFPVRVEDAEESEVSVTVHRKSSARVVVEDGEGPVPGAEVTLRKRGRDVVKATTDDAGVVTSGVIEAGSYTVSVRKPGYYTVQETLQVDGETQTTLAVRRGTVTLEVNVTDDNFDPPRPVGGVAVDVEGSGSVTTQPGGVGRISVPVNAWADISVKKEGYRSTEESVFVAESDKVVQVSIQRVPSISLDLLSSRVVIGENVSLSVTDEYGEPVEGATVRLDGDAVAETDAQGSAVIEVPSAGNHTLTVEAESLEATAQVEGISAAEATAATEAATGADGSDPLETIAEAPGFGVGAALLALVAATLVGLARRRS